MLPEVVKHFIVSRNGLGLFMMLPFWGIFGLGITGRLNAISERWVRRVRNQKLVDNCIIGSLVGSGILMAAGVLVIG